MYTRAAKPKISLYIADNVPDPVVIDDKLLVRIKAFGINRMDLG
jgi:NADPH:quinone reductase-like Zn-dependent oxidoreductase